MSETTRVPAPVPCASGAGPVRVEIFGYDVAEISQIRRIRAIASLGHDVHSFTMRRANMNAGFVPDWPNTHLYETLNEALGRRVLVVLGSILRMAGHRARLRAADVIIARNLDMLAIAWAGRAITGSRARLVYECLDIHTALTGQGPKSSVMRAAERRLLRSIDMLVVSSPGFMREYFIPRQGYDGPHAVWENKLATGVALPPRPRTQTIGSGPLRLGWVGTIRCAPSLALLTELAGSMGPAVEVHIHGVVHRHVLPGFDEAIAPHKNVVYHGAYAYPADLAEIYGGLDLVWSQDLWQSGGNSDWLLPNRIYEASWAGCPSIAVAGTQTGRRVAEDELGWTVEQPQAAALQSLLARLSRDQIAARKQALLDRPDSDFVQSSGEVAEVIERLRSPGSRTRAAA